MRGGGGSRRVGVFLPVTPLHQLLARGLLVRRDAQTVELPREIGLKVRGDRPLGAEKHGTTHAEAQEGEPLDDRLSQEVPEDDA